MTGFVHLRLHTEYSLVDGLVRISRPKDEKKDAPSPHGYLTEAVPQLGMAAVALTDQNNLFAMVKFCQAASYAGIKPILGADVWVEGTAETPSRLTLLCQNETGLRNLSLLLTRAYRRPDREEEPALSPEWLAELNQGLIVLSGAREGDVGKALLSGKQPVVMTTLDFWRRHFPDRYYLELQRTGRANEDAYLDAAVQLATQTDLPVVATNDVRFVRRDDYEAHEARVCIHQGRQLSDPRRPRIYSPEQYLRSPAEMAELFADLPEALENSVEIAKRCNVTLKLGKTVLPQFPIPEELSEQVFFERQVREGLEARIQQSLAAGLECVRDDYEARLALELSVITRMGFTGYFLIVADFVRWAKDNGVPVGPGRGSGAGSLVAYALGITDLDPLRYALLFERFLNPERVSMPDFDIDFCMDGRDRVIDYVAERYGRDRVSQIITYGSMAARAVVRDVGRVLGHGYGFVDRIAKLIPGGPQNLNITLDKALEQEPDLKAMYEAEEDVRGIIDMARALEGLARNAGKHAGGVVIAPSALTDFTPLYCEPGGKGLVTQLDKDDVEAIGLIKFDFLGLRTLTILDHAVRNVYQRTGQTLDLAHIPLDDARTYELMKRQQTTAVFQLESRGIRDIIKRLKPDCFDDIVALVALYRPGPLQSGMVEDFIERKHGRAQASYFHPDLEPVLKPTYGVILYQEQVMQIAQILGGYTLGGADLLRRAMGKKKAEEMAKQRGDFIGGATARGVDGELAETLFDLMEKFAGYGFNKSHSVAYALLAYQTAWLKANHPAAFMAAVLSADMDDTDKIVDLIEECRLLKLKVLPPDVNRSAYHFGVLDEGTIVYGLGAIRGVGLSAVEALIQERDAQGAYTGLDELCRRCDAQKLNRRSLEAMIKAGAFDTLSPHRAALMEELPKAIKAADQHSRDRDAGQVDLFGAMEIAPVKPVMPLQVPDWDEETRLSNEREALGLYLSGHPVSRYVEELKALCGKRITDLKLSDAETGWVRQRDENLTRIAGLVTAVRIRTNDRGKSAFLTLDDRSGRIEVAVFSDELSKYADLAVKDKILVVEGALSFDEFAGGLRLRARRMMDLDQARVQYAKRLEMSLALGREATPIEGLEKLLGEFRGGACPVILTCRRDSEEARFQLSDEWRIQPCEKLLAGLTRLAGVERAALRYS